jgi:hypothetical protein
MTEGKELFWLKGGMRRPLCGEEMGRRCRWRSEMASGILVAHRATRYFVAIASRGFLRPATESLGFRRRGDRSLSGDRRGSLGH